jgi:hypothetical protein
MGELAVRIELIEKKRQLFWCPGYADVFRLLAEICGNS